MKRASTPEGGAGRSSAARSGALVALASIVATGLNYVSLVVAGRLLGSEDYGALAALLGLMTVVLLPTGALQLAVAREVSRLLAVGEHDAAEAFSWAAFRAGLVATVPIVALAVALAFPLAELLEIESAGIVVLAAGTLVASLAFPIATGLLQGYERFRPLAAMYVTPFAIRLLVLLGLAGTIGLGLGGAVGATVAGAVLGAAVALALVRVPLRRGARLARPALGPFLRYLWPVFVGLIGIAVLTNVDVLLVRARFPGDDAGEYAAASAFARVAFFLPATILIVLFPRTAARQARGEDASDILGRSLLVTVAFGGLLAAAYGLVGVPLVEASFGEEFGPGGELLLGLTVAMTLFALANVLLGFHLSRGETRFAWIVAATVPVQILVLSFVPDDVESLIVADIVVALALVVAHELLVGSSLPAVRAGWRRLRRVPLRGQP